MNAIRTLAIFTLFAGVVVTAGCSSKSSESVSAASDESLTSAVGYYTVRNDTRGCQAPLCGGYFVTRANKAMTHCADGISRPECYVANIDLTAAQLSPSQTQQIAQSIGDTSDTTRVVLRGNVTQQSFGDYGPLGVFEAIETWRAPGAGTIDGEFYMLVDSGIRCPTAPCASLNETTLNSLAQQNIDDVDLSSAPGSSDQQAIAENDAASARGLIVAGTESDDDLYGSQYFVRVASGAADGDLCDVDSDCQPGLLCCYPCSVAGCHDVCLDPGSDGQCPEAVTRSGRIY